MSGIFGYTLNKTNNCNASMHCPKTDEYIKALKKWNTSYGNKTRGECLVEETGFGSCLDHLSEDFPVGRAINECDLGYVVLDVILYNRDELCDILNIENKTKCSDEDLLIQFILERGLDQLCIVNGDFAGAIYDPKTKEWILFRDHMGVRPLFYYIDQNIFAFSTDIRGLASIPNVDMSINEKYLYNSLAGNVNFSINETEYKNIHCVRPASYLHIVIGSTAEQNNFITEEHIYWQLGRKKTHLKNEKAYQEELRRLISDSVKRRIGAVTGLVGCELSGGLDSSVIAILISRLNKEACHYSWSYSPDELSLVENDERQIILDICEQEHFDCIFAPTPEQAGRLSIDDILAYDYPAYINTLTLSAGSKTMRAQGAKAIFTGHGGDEGVSHRCNPYEMWHNKEYYAYIRNVYQRTKGKKLRLIRTAKRVISSVRAEKEKFLTPFRAPDGIKHIMKKEFIQKMENLEQPILSFFFDPLSYINAGGSRNRLDNIALQGAENGVRYMVPFLDYRVIDYAVSIPRYLYRNGYENRWIYRMAFDDLLPESLKKIQNKRTVSKNYYIPEEHDWRQRILEQKQGLLNALDHDFWKDYLDFDAIESITLKENYTEEEYNECAFLINLLLLCYLIQKTAKLSLFIA